MLKYPWISGLPFSWTNLTCCQCSHRIALKFIEKDWLPDVTCLERIPFYQDSRLSLWVRWMWISFDKFWQAQIYVFCLRSQTPPSQHAFFFWVKRRLIDGITAMETNAATQQNRGRQTTVWAAYLIAFDAMAVTVTKKIGMQTWPLWRTKHEQECHALLK